ncbi:MAG: OmpA family protein [Thermodesulfovibrionales bacterium]
MSNHELDSDSNWLITLSDLLTLLLVFFIFALTVDRASKIKTSQPTATAMPAITHDQPAAKDNLVSKIMGLASEDGITVRASGGEMLILIKEKATFNPGEAEILKSSEPVLDKIGNIIRQHPALLVEIDGHTDNIPIKTRLYPSNWELSAARATKVLKYFVAHSDVDPSRFFVRGNADRKPLLPNDTPLQRAENRRVEIRLKEALEPKS